MKVIKDATPELVKAEAKDRFYQITGTIERMLAPQDATRPFVYKKKGWGTIERVETTSDGTPEDLRAPKKKRKMRKGEEEIKSADCWTFRLDKDEHIMLPWGTDFGIFKKSLRRSLEAQRKLRYESAPLSLIRVYPAWLDLGKAPAESMRDNNIPERILETRHTQGGDVMVDVFFDYVENRPFTTIIQIDSEAPINEEKFVALIKTLNTLDNVGPSKRGRIRIEKVAALQVSPDELEKLRKGEPVQPVIY